MEINRIFFAGRLVKDPELKALPSGQNVCNFSVASNEKYTNKDGEVKENVEYGNIVVFGKQAENCAKYLTKGSGVLIEGKLQTRSWEKDGVKHYQTEIIAQSVQFGAKPSDKVASTSVDYPRPTEDDEPESVPF